VVSAYNKAFAAGPGTYSFEFRLAGNPTSWFRETIRIDDDRAGVQGVLTDVTDRRALEEHLLQRQRVEALASFAGRAAHDLNNPLMIISGYGEELFESLTETDPRRNDLGQMLAAAKRIGDIAAGMQQFSRKPSPAIASSADASLAIDLAALLVETVDRMRNTAGPSLKVDYVPPSPNTDPVLVFADSGVLQNLIYEITAAMADGAPEVHIAIQAHMRLVREQAFGDQLPSGVYASVTVENRGETATGASARRSMFETILPGKDGSEVGPALAKAFRLVESWGGSIWTSANGGFVRILLRALKPAQADVEATQAVPVGPVAVPMQPTPPPPPPPKRILVVDDEMGIRSLMRKILMREGYSVLEAASAKEAMAAIEQEPVDLLLTDVIMPETSGRQLAEQVVAKYPETRVLYVSGYTGETLVESGQFPPGSRLLQKPVTLGSLLRAVKEVLAETSSGKQSRVAAASAGSAGQ
jgi:two-component system, cell cycle sensor histidine kinase and response regulator CckA